MNLHRSELQGPAQGISWALKGVATSLPQPHPESCNNRHVYQETNPWKKCGGVTEAWAPKTHQVSRQFYCPGQWLSWLEHPSVNQKGCGFDPPSGHIPRLQVPSGNTSRRQVINVSLLHQCFSPHPSTLSKTNDISSCEDLKKRVLLS